MPAEYMNVERTKIEAARDANRLKPVKTLAKELEKAGGLGGRSLLSIYSVIRRYDAKQKAKLETRETGYGSGKKSLAKTVTNALAAV